MAGALADQRVSRKRAQEDVKLLANRIALLKQEEQKVSKSPSSPPKFFRPGKKSKKPRKKLMKLLVCGNETLKISNTKKT